MGVDSLASVDATNCWTIHSRGFLNSATNPASLIYASSTNDGSTFTDSATDSIGIGLLIDSFVAAAGGGGGPLIGGRLVR